MKRLSMTFYNMEMDAGSQFGTVVLECIARPSVKSSHNY